MAAHFAQTPASPQPYEGQNVPRGGVLSESTSRAGRRDERTYGYRSNQNDDRRAQSHGEWFGGLVQHFPQSHKPAPKRPRRRTLAAAALAALVVAAVVGGTYAWLTAQSKPVVNTFTYGDVNLTLTETDTQLDGDEDDTTNTYQMLPGQDIIKDPVVTVKANSVDSWVFVKLEKSQNFDNFLEYTMADGWTQLTDEDGHEVAGVYYREVSTSDEDQTLTVIKDNTVSVKGTVTKADLNALDTDPDNPTYPTLTVTAYAVQKSGFDTAAAAWAQAAGQGEEEPGVSGA